MRVCIHRGTAEIGGTCVEIESQGKRLVLDAGLPLDSAVEAIELHPISGFESPDPLLLGIVISHPHQDHYGLAHRLPPETVFVIGKAAQSILEAAEVFSPSGITLGANVIHMEHRKSVRLGPFTLTPYLVDHSAYDAYATLVEADGQRLFYSGDLRGHGRKFKLFNQLVADPPRNVDVLLMEGTTIGRANTEEGFPTEVELELRLVDIFRETKGMPLVWCSGQNIDRLVTIFRACKRSGRQFIVDMYTAHVLRATGNARIPQASWNGMSVFLPYFQKRRIIRRRAFDVSTSYKPWRIYPEELTEAAPRSVMLFRPSMMRDVEGAGCLNGARLIYSMWAGYLEREENQPLFEWLSRHGVGLEQVHTSGHASLADLRRLRRAFGEALVVPI
jgi:ribonuclease J